MKSFFTELEENIKSLENSKEDELLKLYYDLKSFVLQGTFTSYKQANKILACIDSSDTEASALTGIKAGTIRVARRNMSEELFQLFGYDYFYVSSQNIEEGEFRLKAAKLKFSGPQLPFEITKSILGKNKEDMMYSLDSCTNEIEFLKKYNNINISKELASIDTSKLCYLVELLSMEKGSQRDTFELYKRVYKEEIL